MHKGAQALQDAMQLNARREKHTATTTKGPRPLFFVFQALGAYPSIVGSYTFNSKDITPAAPQSAAPPATPAASFAQVNAKVAVNLRNHVMTTVSAHSPKVLVDAYSGAGDTAIAFAKSGMKVTAIELDGDAARWCALHLPEGSVSIRARVEEALPKALPADAVVLNPPRAGADVMVTDVLQNTPVKPKVITYVSCNPATLARDVARLPGYRIASIVPFDMFPQTAHVETVCELVPEVA